MGKEATFQDFSVGSPQEEQDLWRWLYVELRAAILDGRLKAGARMPSTRSLASQYSLSRGTVVAAFDQLQSEGYTHTRIGSGTYVALQVTGLAVSERGTLDLPSGSRPSKASLSKWGQRYVTKAAVTPAPLHVGCAFRDYEPAIDLFPTELWARVASRVLRRAPRSLYGKGNPRGHPPLRRAIAEYIGSSRGVRCSPEQIIVTAGTQQALDLLGRFLIDPGDKIWMEDPGYPGASQAFLSAGGRLVPVPVDQDGLIVKAGRKLAPQAKVAYVTPANQFPMGVTMSADRRIDLLRWAASANAWIIEDEYDAEYRYFGRPVASLQALDRSNCVIYVGTFTKMLFYALRLGFIVLPERIVDAFAVARSFVDRHPPTLDQAILTEFIADGHFGHHVRRMRQLYAERMDILKAAADKQLHGVLDVVQAGAGMRTLGWLKSSTSDKEASEAARRMGLEVVALSTFTRTYPQPPALILGFAGCTRGELRRGVTLLGKALRADPKSIS